MKLEIQRKLLARLRLAGPAALLLGTLTAPLLAASAPSPRPPRPQRDAEDVRETIQVLMIASMKKALELTRDQEREVIPKVEQVFDERERYASQRREALQTLQVKLMEGSVPEKDYRERVTRLDDLERTHRNLELELRAEIDRSLNGRQRAQLRIFVPRFRRQMQMHIDEARRLHSRPMEGPHPAVPPGDEEWDSGDEEF